MSLAHEPSLAALAASPSAFGKLPELAGAPAAFRFAARLMALNWRVGSLTFITPAGRELRLQGAEPGIDARIVINDFGFMRRVLAAGDIGFAEGYMAGEWDTPDLSAVLIAVGQNIDRLSQLFLGNPLVRAVNFIGHTLHANTSNG